MSQPSLDHVSLSLARSVRAHREAGGLSLGALARKASLSKTILSRIEAGSGNPSLETLWHIAEAMGISLGTLLGMGDPPEIQVIRKGDGRPMSSESGLRARLVFAEGRVHSTEVFDNELDPATDYQSRPHAPGTAELVICLSGTMRLGPLGREVDVASGDAVWFPADVSHRYATQHGAHSLVVMSYQRQLPQVG